MKQLNVLYIAHISTLYGANRSLLNLISGMSEKVSCTVVVPSEGPLTDELRSRQIKFVIVGFKHASLAIKSPLLQLLLYIPRKISLVLSNQMAVRKLSKCLEMDRFDLIHSNSGVITLGGIIARRFRKPHVWHLREFQDVDYSLRYIDGEKAFLKRLREADRIVAISKSIADHFQINQKMEVVYNGVIEEKNLISVNAEKEPYFLFCGALIPAKGIEDAIISFNQVVAIHSHVKLKVIGGFADDAYRSTIMKLIADKRLKDSIDFIEFQPRLDLDMRRSLGLLMCSRNEGLGRVTLEAMVNRCAVIGFNNAGTAELIRHGINGFLYSSPNQLSEYMQILIEQDNVRSCIEDKAFNFVREQFTEERYAEKVLEIYRNVLDERQK